MSALHQAVTRAIAAHSDYDDGWDAQAAVAVRVVLAEATRSIEALPVSDPVRDDTQASGVRDWPRPGERVRAEALAALAALGEQA